MDCNALVSIVKQGKDVWNNYRARHCLVPELAGTDFSGMDLSEMDFRGATLTGANLSETKLTGTNFDGANVKGVNFLHATFTSTTKILPGQLAATAFRGAKGLAFQLLQATLEAIRASCQPKPVKAQSSSIDVFGK